METGFSEYAVQISGATPADQLGALFWHVVTSLYV